MTYTRQTFKMVAEILRETRTGETQLGNGPLADAYWQDRRDIAEAFAEKFVQSNPRFDRARFLTACGLPAPSTKEA
jgi:hypothetical protein